MDKIITLQEIYNNFLNVKKHLFQTASKVGHEPQLILHWTAGNYSSVFDEYHINLTGQGIFHLTRKFDSIPFATYKHNSGTIAVTLCCAYNATPKDLGEYPPTKIQIEKCAMLVSAFSDAFGLPIDKYHVLTHGEVADNEDGTNFYTPYGPKSTCERWDLEYLGTEESNKFDPYDEDGRGGSIIRGKGIWYKNHVFNFS